MEANKNYLAIETLKKSYMQARMFFSDKDHHHAIDILTQIIEVWFLQINLVSFLTIVSC